MRLASRVSAQFQLSTAISPFMFLEDPTLNGVANVVIKLYNQTPANKLNYNDTNGAEMYEELHDDEIPLMLGMIVYNVNSCITCTVI